MLDELIKGDSLEPLLQDIKKTDCDVWLPRFKSETKYELKEPMKKLGLTSIFTRSADLSRITGNGGLYISTVIFDYLGEKLMIN